MQVQQKAKLNQLEEFSLTLIQRCLGNSVEVTSQDSNLPGTPDFVVPRLKLVIFIDGTFWHSGRGDPMYRVATTFLAAGDEDRANFWDKKREENKKRDRRVNKELKEMGYKVVRLKEDRLNGYDPLGYVSRSIGAAIFRTSGAARKR